VNPRSRPEKVVEFFEKKLALVSEFGKEANRDRGKHRKAKGAFSVEPGTSLIENKIPSATAAPAMASIPKFLAHGK